LIFLPLSYLCLRATTPIVIDGDLRDEAWRRAPWSSDFVDIVGDGAPKPRFRTRVKMLWDDNALYVGAELQEPQLQATLTQHDSVIFQDNDFEVFLDPDGDGLNYTELEMNALDTTWDLLLPKPYNQGGQAHNEWELKGLQTAVRLKGKLNDPKTRSKSWNVEIAIPWSALAVTSIDPCPPHSGDKWRINFSRVEWHFDVIENKLVKRPGLREDNWVWSPMGVVDMHIPDRWGYVEFSENGASK
jgi:hypothetical protein